MLDFIADAPLYVLVGISLLPILVFWPLYLRWVRKTLRANAEKFEREGPQARKRTRASQAHADRFLEKARAWLDNQLVINATEDMVRQFIAEVNAEERGTAPFLDLPDTWRHGDSYLIFGMRKVGQQIVLSPQEYIVEAPTVWAASAWARYRRRIKKLAKNAKITVTTEKITAVKTLDLLNDHSIWTVVPRNGPQPTEPRWWELVQADYGPEEPSKPSWDRPAQN